MTKASDNAFPSILITEGTEPSAPAAGKQRVYIDSTSHHLKRTDSGGNDVDLESPSSYTVPTVVAAGTPATGTGDVTPGLPVAHTTNDILLLFVQSENQTAAAPAGYVKVGPAVGIGTAAAAASTRLTIFWKRDGGAETDPTVLDTGGHTLAVMLAVRGCATTGDPFISVGQTRKTTASTTGTAAGGGTHVDACLIVNAFAHALDSASAVFSAPTNADLGSVTEQIDTATADGNGGGLGVFTGTKSVAGTFAATTVTETSTVDVSSTIYMIPSGATTAGAVDRQVFLTPGVAVDTWTKPSGAKVVDMIGIGSGASGSGGRNAATAAGGGGGGGGGYARASFAAGALPATLTMSPGTGGAATAHSDGAASNIGANSLVNAAGPVYLMSAGGGYAAGVSATGAGGTGGGGASFTTGVAAPAAAAQTTVWGSQPAPGGTGGTTAAAGSHNFDAGGGGGAGGGTTQAASAGGQTRYGGGGGGGGRSNTNVGTGGGSTAGVGNAGGATAGAAGADSPWAELGGGGGAGGTSAAGTGGRGGWPGGGGGGGGSQVAAQGGGAGADGAITMITYC